MYLTYFLCILVYAKLSGASFQPCDENTDCPDNYYCYMTTNVCAPCKPNFCSRLQRESSWKKCPTEPDDCGNCLPGYEEEILSDGLKRDSCIMSPQKQTSPTTQAMASMITIEGSSIPHSHGLIGIAIVMLGLCFFVYAKFHGPSNRVPHRSVEEIELKPVNNQRNQSDAPTVDVYSQATAPLLLPEYSRQDPCRPFENVSYGIENSDSKQTVFKLQDEHNAQINQKAISCQLVQTAVFRRPDYEEEYHNNVSNVQDQEEDDDEDANSQQEEATCPATPFQYHDENTVPSDWTPEPTQAEAENPSPSTGTESVKRLFYEMASSESEDEQNPKRLRDEESDEERKHS